MDRVEQVYQRLAAYKKNSGVSYKYIAKQCGFSQGVMDKLTSRSARRMTDENLDKLVAYLDSVGA